jgi:nitroreductase
MDTLQAIRTRSSIRAFLPRPVPQALIEQVLEAARWAPTGVNRQQWRVTVAAGEACAGLAERLVARAREKEPRTPQAGGGAPAEVQARIDALVADLEGIAERLDKSLWEFVIAGSYGFYGAPAVIVVSHPGQRGHDVPQFVTTLLLAAHAVGLGTCWLGYPLSYRDLIRETLEIPAEERLAAVVALGYPDPDSPANDYRSPRDAVEAFTRWVGFE